MKDPHTRGNRNSHPIRITSHKPGWFYHRAVHVKLPGGHEGILTARAKKTVLGSFSDNICIFDSSTIFTCFFASLILLLFIGATADVL